MKHTTMNGSSTEFTLPSADKPTVDTKVDARAADVHFKELGLHSHLMTGAIKGIATLFRRDSHRLLKADVAPAPTKLGIEELPQR